MGIRGLSSYADSIKSLWTQTQLEQTKVIIDGSALLWKLYLDAGIDYQCGGNYDELADVMRRFFKSLESNGIKPFVIIDGPTGSRNIKLETIKSRFEQDIQSSHKLSIGRGGSRDSILPILAMGVYIQELENLGVPFAVCDCEADQEVASLANHWDCPVISKDSDFLIFDLPAGYIPLPTLNWKKRSVTGRLYKRQRLADHLEIRVEFLPLFASLVGNDFIKDDILAPFERVLSSGNWPSDCTKNEIKITRTAKLLSKSTDRDKALNSALQLVPEKKKRAKLKSALEESMKEYLIMICDLTLERYFETEEVQTSLKTLSQEYIPSYIIERYRRGLFAMKYMGVLISGRRFLHTQVEKSNNSTVHDCSSELRLINYAIVMNPLHKGQESDTQLLVVNEWSRDRRSMKQSCIKPLFESINGYGEPPRLHNLEETDVDKRRGLLLRVLQANTKAVASLPESFQLFAASVRYWILKATPRVHHIWVQALILVHLQLLDQRNATSSTESISHFDIDLQHSLAQWQAVMMETICLNRILLDPFDEPNMSTLYNGVKAQSVVRKIKKGKNAESFVETKDIYKQLYTAVTERLEIELPKEEACANNKQSVESSENSSTTRHRNPPKVLRGNKFALLYNLRR